MGKSQDPKQPGGIDPAIIDALILERMDKHDAYLQREINQLRSFVEQYAGATTLQCVIENGIADVVDKIGELTGKPKEPDCGQKHVLERIARETMEPANTDLFAPVPCDDPRQEKQGG